MKIRALIKVCSLTSKTGRKLDSLLRGNNTRKRGRQNSKSELELITGQETSKDKNLT
jgi:hypothetical protein